MKTSLFVHEMSHAVHALLSQDTLGTIRSSEDGGAVYAGDTYAQWTKDFTAHNAIAGLAGGFFIEVHTILNGKQSPEQLLETFITNKSIPTKVRYGLSSVHASASDLEAIADYDLDEFANTAPLGWTIGMILLRNPEYLNEVSESISETNHLLLDRADAEGIMRGEMPKVRIGNASIYLASGQVMHPAQAVLLTELIKGAI